MLTENIWYLKMTKELKDIAAHFSKDQFTTDKAKLEKYGCSFDAYLEANPSKKKWAELNPEMANKERIKLQSID